MTGYYEHTLSDVPRREVYRYMGMKQPPERGEVYELVEAVLPEFLTAVRGRAQYLVLPVTVTEAGVDFGLFRADSRDLARNLRGCDRAAVFAATLGMETERQKRIAGVTSPAKALVLDAMGSAGIEEVCDGLCRQLAEQYPDCVLHPRFSPGYGDLPLELQKTLLGILDAGRALGVSLSEGMLMIPQKSVTAIVGLERTR